MANLDAKVIERGVASSPGSVSLVSSAIAIVRKVKYFPEKLASDSKFHISVGHTTVMGSIVFFGAKELSTKPLPVMNDHEDEPSASLGGGNVSGLPILKFDFNEDFLYQDKLIEDVSEISESHVDENLSKRSSSQSELPLNWAVIHFQTPIFCPLNSLIIGSRLDTNIHANTCRLAFSGRLIQKFDKENVNFYSWKVREGIICRLGEPYIRNIDKKVVRYEVYGSDLFKKETNMSQFVGLKVETASGDVGTINSSFGTSGKFRVCFPAGTEANEGDKLFLRFKRYVSDKVKAMHQDVCLPEKSPGVLQVSEKKENEPTPKQKRSKNASTSKIKPNQVGSISSEGEIVSLKPDNIVIVSGFFTPEINIREKIGWKVKAVETGEDGIIKVS